MMSSNSQIPGRWYSDNTDSCNGLKKRKWLNLKVSEKDCDKENVAEHVGHAVVIKFRRVMATRSRSLFCGLKPAARVEHGGGDKDSRDAAPVNRRRRELEFAICTTTDACLPTRRHV
jgi:hypothetical protein